MSTHIHHFLKIVEKNFSAFPVESPVRVLADDAGDDPPRREALAELRART
jgi:hypothetical protein